MILNRKNLIFVLIICLILVFICMYKENNNNYKKEAIIQTNGTPVSTHTVILDAGHGEPDRSEQALIVVLQNRK